MADLEDVAGGALAAAMREAASLITSTPRRLVRVISHYDVDGICAGSITTAALLRAGVRVHSSFMDNPGDGELARIAAGSWEAVVVSDMGSGQMTELGPIGRPMVVLDHHMKQGGERPAHVREVNALDFGLEGAKDVSGAGMAFLFALALGGEANWDLAPLALAGAIGDMQDVGGFRRLNAAILAEAVRRGTVERRQSIAISGPTVAEALVRSNDPFVKGVSGRPEGAAELLSRLGIEGGRPLEGLTQQQVRALGSVLVTKLVGQGAPARNAQRAVQERLRWTARGVWLDDFSHEVNAAGRLNKAGVGAGACLGNPAHVEVCRRAREEYRTDVRTGLVELERKGTTRMRHVQWFDSPAGHVSGSLAGLGIIYVLPKDAPVLALFPTTTELKVSARGTDELVAKGMDLARAMELAAGAVAGRGGGHPVAAGATVPLVAREEFLARVDEIVGGQLAKSEARLPVA